MGSFLPSFFKPPLSRVSSQRARAFEVGGREGDARHAVSTRTRLPATCPPEIGAASSPARPQKHKHKREKRLIVTHTTRRGNKHTDRPVSFLSCAMSNRGYSPGPANNKSVRFAQLPSKDETSSRTHQKSSTPEGMGCTNGTLLFYRRNQSSMIG